MKTIKMIMPFSVENILRERFERFEAIDRGYKQTNGRDHAPKLSISDDMPEAGGGGESAGAPEVAASDDDDGGDDDGEPARRRPQPHKHPSHPALLGFASLSHYVSFGRSRIYGLIAEGEFPKPIKIGKSSRWVRAEIDAWINTQSAQRIGG